MAENRTQTGGVLGERRSEPIGGGPVVGGEEADWRWGGLAAGEVAGRWCVVSSSWGRRRWAVSGRW